MFNVNTECLPTVVSHADGHTKLQESAVSFAFNIPFPFHTLCPSNHVCKDGGQIFKGEKTQGRPPEVVRGGLGMSSPSFNPWEGHLPVRSCGGSAPHSRLRVCLGLLVCETVHGPPGCLDEFHSSCYLE